MAGKRQNRKENGGRRHRRHFLLVRLFVCFFLNFEVVVATASPSKPHQRVSFFFVVYIFFCVCAVAFPRCQR